jgi:peroxiredoxin
VPDVVVLSTGGRWVSLARESKKTRVVVYAYPRMERPDEEPAPGWDAIPGARGSTPQSCGFRDLHDAFGDLGVRVFGLSTQHGAFQREDKERLALPFELLSDAHLFFAKAPLRLPTFVFAGETLLTRLALVLRGGKIEKVFYPVFLPDENAREVLTWLRATILHP